MATTLSRRRRRLFAIALVAAGCPALGVGTAPPAAAGPPASAELRVNTFTTSTQTNASIGMDAGGDFVVVWESLNQDGSNLGVYVQRFDAAGNPCRSRSPGPAAPPPEPTTSRRRR